MCYVVLCEGVEMEEVEESKNKVKREARVTETEPPREFRLEE